MEYDRLIAISNDKTVYRHGNKCIKVYAFEESFVSALEEALKTSKVKIAVLLIAIAAVVAAGAMMLTGGEKPAANDSLFNIKAENPAERAAFLSQMIWRSAGIWTSFRGQTFPGRSREPGSGESAHTVKTPSGTGIPLRRRKSGSRRTWRTMDSAI